mgnify:CR=1 FL=1
MKKIGIFLIILAVFCVFSLSTQAEDYRLDTGDQLTVVVRGVEELQNVQVTVREDGYISFPFAGEIYARGKTLSELKSDLDSSLTTYLKAPESVVVLTLPRQVNIGIIGAVHSPGTYSIPNQLNILSALSFAGGPDLQFAKLISVKIYKKDGRMIKVNVRKLINSPEDVNNYPIENGDVIFVPKKFFSWELATVLQILSVVTITLGIQRALEAK